MHKLRRTHRGSSPGMARISGRPRPYHLLDRTTMGGEDGLGRAPRPHRAWRTLSSVGELSSVQKPVSCIDRSGVQRVPCSDVVIRQGLSCRETVEAHSRAWVWCIWLCYVSTSCKGRTMVAWMRIRRDWPSGSVRSQIRRGEVKE